MKKTKSWMYLPIITMMILMAGMVMALSPVINTCTMDGVAASTGEKSNSNVQFACYVSNATTCNMQWGGSNYSTVASTVVCSGTLAATSNVSLKCLATNVGDSAKSLSYNCADAWGNITTGTEYSITVAGNAVGTTGGSLTTDGIVINMDDGRTKTLLIVFICAIGGLCAGALYLFSKKK